MKAAAQPWQQEKLFSIEKLCVLAEGMNEVALQEVLAKNGVVVGEMGVVVVTVR